MRDREPAGGVAEPTGAAGAPYHVTNGDSTAQTLRRTALPGAVVAWRDVLHEGPVPLGDAETVREARARFLAEGGWDTADTAPNVLDELRHRDRAFLAALTEGREVVLWFEHDLYDQLQLVQALALASESGVSTESARLICIDRFDGHPRFAGLGELNEDELASLWDVRRPVDRAMLSAAVTAWDALRQPDPRAVEALASAAARELPFLPAALTRLLEEFPATGDGLGRTDRELLKALEQRASTPIELMLAIGEAEEAPFMGDTWVWRRLADLGAGPTPLVATGAGIPFPEPPPRGNDDVFGALTIRLTDGGRDVLAGRADRVAAVGIDRWLGGTHVHGRDPWRWSRENRRVVAPLV